MSPVRNMSRRDSPTTPRGLRAESTRLEKKAEKKADTTSLTQSVLVDAGRGGRS